MTANPPLVVHLIAAARPNFMKIAPLYHALAREPWCTPQIVHTGQHYDANMSDAFFRDLRPAQAALPPGSRQRHARRADRRRDDRLRKSRAAREAGLDHRRGRRQFDRCLRAWSAPSSGSRWCTSRPGCAAATAACPRRSTGWSRTRSATCIGRRRPTPTSTSRARACPPPRSTASATSCSTRSR